MMRLSLSGIGALLLTSAAYSQTQPMAGSGDPHLQTVDYDPGGIVVLRGAPGYQLMVELSPDDDVRNVALGDSAAWQISVNGERNRLFLKPMQSDVATNMTVVTSVRVYNFDLRSQAIPTSDLPYTVQFHYPAEQPSADDTQYVDVSSITRRLSRYRISGNRPLRPTSVTDDGQRTYISWPRGAPIPAVYAPDRFGHEMLLNGMMGADDVYVVDGAPQKLTFRIDRNVARAERINPRKRR
jgi:type IV secretion system protein VirB9